LEVARPIPETTTTKTTRQREDILGEFMPVNIETTVTGKWGSTTTTTQGQTPLNTRFQDVMPSDKVTNPMFRVADLTNPYSMPFAVSGVLSESITNRFNPSNSQNMKEQTALMESFTGLGGKYT
jgi:hypothetical protein